MAALRVSSLGGGVGPRLQRHRTPTECLRSKDSNHPPSPYQNFLQPTCKTHFLTNCTIFLKQKHSLWGLQAKEYLKSHLAGHSGHSSEDCLPSSYVAGHWGLVQLFEFPCPRSRLCSSPGLSKFSAPCGLQLDVGWGWESTLFKSFVPRGAQHEGRLGGFSWALSGMKEEGREHSGIPSAAISSALHCVNYSRHFPSLNQRRELYEFASKHFPSWVSKNLLLSHQNGKEKNC